MGATFQSLVGLIIVLLDAWAVVHVARSGTVVGLKLLWGLLIVLLPVLGLIIWAIAGPRVPAGS